MATDTLTAPVIMGTASRPKIYRNFIDGEWVEASTGETFENRDPADTRDVIGIFQRSGKADVEAAVDAAKRGLEDRKSTRLNSSHSQISYAVFCLKKKKKYNIFYLNYFVPSSVPISS